MHKIPNENSPQTILSAQLEDPPQSLPSTQLKDPPQSLPSTQLKDPPQSLPSTQLEAPPQTFTKVQLEHPPQTFTKGHLEHPSQIFTKTQHNQSSQILPNVQFTRSPQLLPNDQFTHSPHILPSVQFTHSPQILASVQHSHFTHTDKDYPDQITQITLQLRNNLELATQHLVKSGSLLLIAKDLLPHGQFQSWLQNNFNMSSKTANRLMSVAKMVNKLDMPSDMLEKIANLDLSVLYEISAKSTTEEVQHQVFEEIAMNHPISYELVRMIKKKTEPKQSQQESESDLHKKTEFLKFMKVLKKFSIWFDRNQPHLYSPQAEIQEDLKQELEIYAQKLKAATDIVKQILEQKVRETAIERVRVISPSSINVDSTMSSLI